MMNTSTKKRNPGMFLPKVTYSLPYLSPFRQFMSQDFSFGPQNISNKEWLQYPLYLRESLFYFNKNFQKVREVEIGYKFFSADELRE